MDTIAVSVVVAAYNRELLLDRCLDSLVYQSFDNMEIIVVDDFSTDNTWSVMEKWEKLYPEKVRIMKSEAKGVAHAKNTGIKASRGEYIAFVDSDDYVDYKMFQWLYDATKGLQPKMVFSPIWKLKGKNKWKAGTLPKLDRPYVTEDFLAISEPGFLVGKLIRRDLFTEFGLIPVFKRGEDLCWLYTVYSYIDSIIYVDKPGYVYELHYDSICSNVTDSSILEDILSSADYMIKYVNPQYKDWAIAYSLKRVQNMKYSYALYYDKLNAWLRNQLEELGTRTFEDLPSVLQSAIEYSKKAEIDQIPHIVYLNGFEGKPAVDNLEIIFGATEENINTQILNEENCNVCENQLVKQAYELGNYSFVANYFAIKACYEQGGIFIDNDMVIDNPINKILEDPCFFGFESNSTISAKIFGAFPGNPVMKNILATYEMPDLYEDPFASLGQRIKTVLIGMGNIQMSSGIIRKLEYGFCLYPVDMFVFTLPYAENPHVSHYKPEAFSDELTMQVPLRVLQSLADRRVRIEVDKVNSQLNKQKKLYAKEHSLSLRRSQYIKKNEQTIAYMRNSLSWKITKPLRWLRRLFRG